jgi:hypothetical protein
MSQVFSVWELLLMALPLVLAIIVEVTHLQLFRWRRLLEIVCLLGVIACKLANLGWVMIVIILLFMLCGIRLSLPREQGHRRQIVFMALLLFMLTTVANTSISFLPMALLWTATACMVLLKLNSPSLSIPQILKIILPWTLIATLISGLLFVILPRPILRWRPLPFGANGFIGSTAGLSDSLSLEGLGAIHGNSEVVCRILPPPDTSQTERIRMESRMALLTGFRMEHAELGLWERSRYTPRRRDIQYADVWTEDADLLEYYVYPSPTGLIPMPQGEIQIIPPANMRIEQDGNGITRWAYPPARPMPFRFKLDTLVAETISEWQIDRRGLLTSDPATEEALRWSLQVAPEPMHPTDLVRALSRDLQTFKYTLDNPSGAAKDPLGDFLTRTRAGHCEYFAHALASALRHRGVASRVVNGYRLGKWIEEGGYWLVTQNQAHSWVEYVNPDTETWETADPTPPGADTHTRQWILAEKLGRVMDTLRFRWDCYVVRFSEAEQQRGISWIQIQAAKLRALKPSQRTVVITLLGVSTLCALITTWKVRNKIKTLLRADIRPGAVSALRPLIRATKLHPSSGETLRAWIQRLCTQRPDRSQNLMQLLSLIEENTYGNKKQDIAKPIKQEAKAW